MKKPRSALQIGEGELYRVRHGGLKDEELVTGETPKAAAARFIQARGVGVNGFVCVREPGGREHRFFTRKAPRK